MITPSQLKTHEFKTAGRNAYKADDVDLFFGEILVDYEKMFRENSDLIKKISLLADRLEQYKNDEGDIKQAVMSAQKAANLIIKDAEDSVADSKAEAEAILAAAKGEADIIKADAEKQAIADAELALSVAKDKAEEIIAKAKEKAHGILIAANDSASDTMGVANRTITSESLHYEMLKKEVSEFRASVLAQYKTHIEMISKLPELAVEEAGKINNVSLPETSVDEIEKYVDNGFTKVDEKTTENDDSVLEFVNDNPDDIIDDDNNSEPVIKTELPYDFYNNDSKLEYVNDDEADEEFPTIDEFNKSMDNEMGLSDFAPADIPISRKFKVDLDSINSNDFTAEFNQDSNEAEGCDIVDNAQYDIGDDASSDTDGTSFVEETTAQIDDNFGYEDDDNDDEFEAITPNFFDNIEKIDTEDDGSDDEKKSKGFGFFKKKNK